MALEHALLVSLSERPAAGLDLTRRFQRSIGFFWQAKHQQIYRVLGRMEADGWIVSETVAQHGRPDKRVYRVTPLGCRVLADWLATPTPLDTHRSELAVKLRGASYGDRGTLLEQVATTLAEHQARLAHYEALAARDYPDPDALDGADLDRYLVLRGGLALEQFWISWLGDYLAAWQAAPRQAPRHAPRKDSA